jgi:hypothetical protein
MNILWRPSTFLIRISCLLGFVFIGGGILISCSNRNTVDDCTKQVVASSTSPSKKYSASIVRIVCVAGSETSYQLNITAASVHPEKENGWTTSLMLESDLDGGPSPLLKWDAGNELHVTIETKTLTGELRQHMGYDLTIHRSFSADSPNAFPNF